MPGLDLNIPANGDLQPIEPGVAEKEIGAALKTAASNLSAYNLYNPEAQTVIDARAIEAYDQLTDSGPEALLSYAGKEVKNLNDTYDLLLEKIEPVDVERLQQLSADLISKMAGLKKYDIRSQQVLQQVQGLEKYTRHLFQKAASYPQSLLDAARGEKGAIDGLLGELMAERLRLLRNASFLKSTYRATNQEILDLTLATAVLEKIRVLANEELEGLGKQDAKLGIDTETKDQIGDLTAFIRLVDLKLDGLRTRLADSTQSAAHLRDQHLSVVAMATTINSLEELAVPGMKGTVLSWFIEAQTMQAGQLREVASHAYTDWKIARAESAAELTPKAMEQAFTPITPEEAIVRITELDQQRGEGIKNAYKAASDQMQRANDALRLQRLSSERIDREMAELIDPELAERTERLSRR